MGVSVSRLVRNLRPFAHPIQSPCRDALAWLGCASEFRRREIKIIIIEKWGEVSTQQRSKTCVNSFAGANIQRPQADEAEEADKQEKTRAPRHAGLKSKVSPKGDCQVL